MRKINPLFFFCIITLHGFAQYSYPKAYRSDDKIERFGCSVPDPYRWLEKADSKQTKDWLTAQEELVRKYRNNSFGKYSVVERDLIYTIVADSVSNYVKQKIGGYYFNISYDYKTDNSPTINYKEKISYGWGKLLSTAQFLRDDKDVISVKWISVSRNDSIAAIGISHGGSDWTEIRLVDMNTHKVLNEKLEWTKFGTAWGKEGIFYSKFDKPEGDEISSHIAKAGIYYHKIGTPPDKDIIISEPSEADKDYATVEKGKFFILYESKTEQGKKIGIWSYIASDSIGKGKMKTFLMVPNLESNQTEIIGEKDGMFIAKSTHKAPKGKIMLYDYSKMNQGKQWIEMFSQTLTSAHFLKNKLICFYIDKGNYLCFVFDTAGKLLKNIQIPPGMSISGFDKMYGDSLTYYYINSFSMPRVTMRFNMNTLKSEIADEYAGFALSSKYITEVVSYKSKDSTDIYMYVTYNKDLKRDGHNPVLIDAYGGFGIINAPDYNPAYGLLLRRDAILAVPLIRGGGELGSDWHNAGRKRNKQNSVDDVAAAARWLIDNKFTTPEKMAITGGSQGGWLMGTVAVQYPHLFKAVVPVAGIYDMLRYNQFSSSAGVGLPEFGDPDDSLDFKSLLNISPIYNMKKGVSYPASFVIIGKNDNRVVPSHSYKLVASLQENGNPEIPYLLYLEENTGHNVTANNEWIEQLALMYTFIMSELGMTIHN